VVSCEWCFVGAGFQPARHPISHHTRKDLTMTKITNDNIDTINSETKTLCDKLDFKQSTDLSNKAYKLAIKQKYPKGIAEALLIRGTLFWLRQESLQAREVFMQAYKIIETLGDSELLHNVYYGLGIAYSQLLLLEECTMYFTKALEVSKMKKNDSYIARDYTNLAIALAKLENHSQAIDFFNRAMIYAKKISDEKRQSAILTNLSMLHLKMGDYENALKQGFEALKSAEKYNDTLQIITIHHNISASSIELKRFDQAEHYMKLCLTLAKENNVAHLVTITELLKAKLKLYQGKYDEVKSILQNVENSPRFKGDVEAIYRYYHLFLKLYEATGDYKNAYEKLKELMEFEKKQAEANLKTKLEIQELKLTLKS